VRPCRPPRHVLRALAVVGLAVVTILPSAMSASAGSSQSQTGQAALLSGRPIALSTAWQSDDEAPTSSVVLPSSVIDVVGGVTDPEGLTGAGGTTTLTYEVGGKAPSLVLDYGRDVGGFPTFTVTSTSGTLLSASYSETLHNLGNDGALTVAQRHLPGALCRRRDCQPDPGR
jgi:hypothetical protein